MITFPQYEVRVGDDLGDPDYWNTRFQSLDLRVHGQELIEKDWRDSVRELQENGLKRIDDAIKPLLSQLEQDAQLGALFVSASTSALAVKVGRLTVAITAANRQRFAPAATVALVTDAAPYAVMIGTTVAYNRTTGTLTVEVERAYLNGGAATRAGWVVSATSRIDYLAERVFRTAGGGLESTTVEAALREILGLTVPVGRSVTAGLGLKGGGNLGDDVELALDLVYSDARYVRAQAFEAHTHAFGSLSAKPTTLAGYGVTDAYTKTQLDASLAGKSNVGHGHAVGDTIGLQAALDAKLDDGQASATGLSVLGAASQAVARTALGLGALAILTSVATAHVSDSAITNAKLASVSAGVIKGRATAGAGAVEDLTAGQVKTLLAIGLADVSGLQSALDSKLAAASVSTFGASLLDDADAAAARATLGLGALAILSTVATGSLADGAATNAKLASVTSGTFKARATAGSGAVEDLTAAQAKALLAIGVSDVSGLQAALDAKINSSAAGATGSALLGAATAAAARTTLGLGSLATLSTVATGNLADSAATNAKLANVSTGTLKGRVTAGAGSPEDLTPAQVRTLLALGVSDVSGLQAALDAKQAALGYTAENLANKGVANGYAPLGADGKVPAANLPADGSYKGTYDASTNTPEISSGSGTQGDFYIVSKAGTVAADNVGAVAAGDQLRRGPTAWQRVPSFNAVSSVAGRTGAVTLASADLTDATAVGKALVAAADASAARTTLGLGSLATKSAIASGDIADGAVANVDLAQVASGTFKARSSAGTGAVEDLTAAQAKTLLALAIGDVSGLQAALDAKLAASTVSTFGASLIDDADAAAARTTLGLGGLATKSAIASGDITDGAVANVDLAQVASGTFKARSSAGTGAIEDLTAAQAKTLLALAISDVSGLQAALDAKLAASTVSTFGASLIDDASAAAARTTLGLGGLATKSAIASGDITDGAVANVDLAQVASGTFKARSSAGTGVIEDLTAAQAKTLLAITTADVSDFGTAIAGKADATALNASNLTDGTVPDARMSGTYTGVGLKRTFANPLMVAGPGTANLASRLVSDLVTYRGNGTITGAIVFLAPNNAHAVMQKLRISGYNYNGSSSSLDVEIETYFTTQNGFVFANSANRGLIRPLVRLAQKVSTSQAAFIIGDVDTVWSWPHLAIASAMFAHAGASDTYCANWSTELVTALDDYGTVVTAIDRLDQGLAARFDAKLDAASVTAFGRSLVDDADAASARATLGLGSAATTASTAYAAAAHVGAGGTAHPIATTSVAGFMSGADRTKLDGIAANANAYTHPTGDGNLHVPATGTGNAKRVLTAGSTAGSLAWAPYAFGDLVGLPTTLSGFGITDAYSKGTVDTLLDGKQESLGYTAEDIAKRGVANGYVPLDGTGKISSTFLPATAITDTSVVATQAAMLALTAQKGDVAIRSDLSKTFILKAEPASTLANWQELATPTDAVSSVAGRAGAVTLTSADLTDATAFGRSVLQDASAADLRSALGLGTFAQKSALAIGDVPDALLTNAKLANMAALTIKGRISSGAGDPQDLTAAQVKTILALGISDVSGLADVLSAKAPTANPTFTGTTTTAALTATGLSTVSDLLLARSTGNDGGGLRLQKPGQNSTIAGDVNIDSFGNLIRFFEGGGGFRGFKVDLTTFPNNYDANLWHSYNFNPSTKADLASPAFTGTPTAPAFAVAGRNVFGGNAYAAAAGNTALDSNDKVIASVTFTATSQVHFFTGQGAAETTGNCDILWRVNIHNNTTNTSVVSVAGFSSAIAGLGFSGRTLIGFVGSLIAGNNYTVQLIAAKNTTSTVTAKQARVDVLSV